MYWWWWWWWWWWWKGVHSAPSNFKHRSSGRAGRRDRARSVLFPCMRTVQLNEEDIYRYFLSMPRFITQRSPLQSRRDLSTETYGKGAVDPVAAECVERVVLVEAIGALAASSMNRVSLSARCPRAFLASVVISRSIGSSGKQNPRSTVSSRMRRLLKWAQVW